MVEVNTQSSYGAVVRSYDQYCPIAVALDVVGDRWTLLILRELHFGQRRFTDLRAALPGLAPNLLTERLRGLEQDGLVERAQLPPPAARTVYALTPQGRATAPVLQALARYGAARLGPPTGPIRPAMTVHGLLVPYHRPDGARLHVRLVVDGESFDLVSDGAQLSTRRRAEEHPDVLVTTTAAELVAVRRGERPLSTTDVRGPADDRERFRRMFALDGQLAKAAEMAEPEATSPLA
jgi:DNA-binding HxlR family transcriptional regulator